MNLAFLQTVVGAMLLISRLALGAEVTILCTLDDDQSQKFCRQSSLSASACQRTYAIDDAKQAIRELNASRILPAFSVRSWSPTSLDAARTVEVQGGKMSQIIGTQLDRISGRLIQSSTYVNNSTKELLSAEALATLEVEQVNKFGLWGYLDRVPVTGMCKATQRAF